MQTKIKSLLALMVLSLVLFVTSRSMSETAGYCEIECWCKTKIQCSSLPCERHTSEWYIMCHESNGDPIPFRCNQVCEGGQ